MPETYILMIGNLNSYVLFAGMILQIVLQIFCAVEAYYLFKLLNHKNRWWVLSIAFLLMAWRRVTALLTFEFTEIDVLSLSDKLLLPLTISVLLFLGLKFLYRNVEITQKNRLKELEELTNKLTQRTHA